MTSLTTKKALIDEFLTQLNTQVAAALVQYYNAFTAYQLALKAYFDAWVELVKGADEVAIATAQISIHAQRATAAAGDIAFYIQANEQAVRAKTLVVTDAVLAWLTAVNANAADVAAKRMLLKPPSVLSSSLKSIGDVPRISKLKLKLKLNESSFDSKLLLKTSETLLRKFGLMFVLKSSLLLKIPPLSLKPTDKPSLNTSLESDVIPQLQPSPSSLMELTEPLTSNSEESNALIPDLLLNSRKSCAHPSKLTS